MSVMMSIILYGIALFGGGLGLIVFLRNPQNRSHRLFLALSLSIALWIVSNAVFATTPDNQTAYIIALGSYAFAASTAVMFFYFVGDLAGSSIITSRVLAWGSAIYIAVSGLPKVIAVGVSGNAVLTTPFIFLYAIVMASLFIGGIFILLRGIKHAYRQRKQQLTAVLFGLIGGIIGGVLLNLILPIYGDYRFIQLGPAFSVLFIITSAYAIVRHRLFDIRAALARVVAYSLALITVAAGYVIITYSIAVPLITDSNTGNAQWLYLAMLVLVALTFQPIKHFFDRATRAIFFKNAYDTQDVLDRLGALLVREVEVVRLVKRSMQLLNDAIQSERSEIILMKDQERIRDVALGASFKHADDIIAALPVGQRNIIIADDLAEQGGSLYSRLTAAHVALAMPLVTSKVTVGYLLVGYKASGDAFTNQDINLVRFFADGLAVAVQNALRFEEITHFNVTLKDEIADATTQLRESNKKLHRLDEAKDEFISMASHQLRTPLTSIKGYLSMVLEGDAGKISEDQRKLLEEAYSSSQRMVYLIGDFLNVSRLQTGKFMLEEAPVNMARLLREEVEQLGATAARRNITLTYQEPHDFPEVDMDEGKMRQVVMNFIDNAIFYSRPNGNVAIELTVNGKDLIFAVHDSGIGVPATERHHLFTKFYRASNARKVRPDGTGIGLYMAKKVITAHGGSVIFETREGKGSTFGFRLPIKGRSEH